MFRERRLDRVKLSWADFDKAVAVLAYMLAPCVWAQGPPGIYGIPRGGLVLAVALSHRLTLRLLSEPMANMLLVDDIVDTGETINRYANYDPLVCTWLVRPGKVNGFPNHAQVAPERTWIVFPWEVWDEREGAAHVVSADVGKTNVDSAASQ